MYPDKNVLRIFAGWPPNVRTAYDPQDPLHILIRAAWGAGLYNFEYRSKRELDNRFPHTANLAQARELYKVSAPAAWSNPKVTGVIRARDEEEFWFGKPTGFDYVGSETLTLPVLCNQLSGLLYTRPSSADQGKLYYLTHNITSSPYYDDGTLCYVPLQSVYGDLEFDAERTDTEYQYATQDYATTGFDQILELSPEEDLDPHPGYMPMTNFLAKLPQVDIDPDSLKIYDILNLDASGNATEVPRLVDIPPIEMPYSQWSFDPDTSTITFLSFSGLDRPDYRVGTQTADPGWNSTYIAEYRYKTYQQAHGLSPLNYIQEYGLDGQLIAGTMPNVTAKRIINDFESYSYTAGTTTYHVVSRSTIKPNSTFTGSIFYSNSVEFTWDGSTPLALSEKIASSIDEVRTASTDDAARILMHNTSIGYKISIMVDDIEYELPSDKYTVTSDWNTATASIVVDLDAGAKFKFYYQSIYIWADSAVSARSLGDAYDLVPDSAGRLIKVYKTLLPLDKSLMSLEEQALTFAITDYIYTTDRDIRSGVAVDQYRDLVWVIENYDLVAHNKQGIEVGRFFLPYLDSITTEDGESFPVLQDTVSSSIYSGLCAWRNYLLTLRLYTEDLSPHTALCVIDPNKPEVGVVWEYVISEDTHYNQLTIGPSDHLLLSTAAGIVDYFKIRYDYFMVDYNELYFREWYSSITVDDAHVITTYNNLLKIPVATSIDNMLSLMSMDRLPALRNDEDGARIKNRLLRRSNSTQQGLVNALLNEFAITEDVVVSNRNVYILQHQPLGYDSRAVDFGFTDYFPIDVQFLSSSISTGRQGVNIPTEITTTIPASSIRIYDANGNWVIGWRWIVWMDESLKYTQFLEFNSSPPQSNSTPVAFKAVYWISGPDGEPVKYSEVFYPKVTHTTAQPVELEYKNKSYNTNVFGVWGLNNTTEMKRLGYIDFYNRPTKKLRLLIKQQEDITKLKWGNGVWDFTPWANEQLQLIGAETLPALFDQDYLADKPTPEHPDEID
jgi:hypothetical protein